MMTSTPTMAAVVRCEYSMIAVRWSGGSRCPWHNGQSGQPRPEPVVRTYMPLTMAADDGSPSPLVFIVPTLVVAVMLGAAASYLRSSPPAHA